MPKNNTTSQMDKPLHKVGLIDNPISYVNWLTFYYDYVCKKDFFLGETKYLFGKETFLSS